MCRCTPWKAHQGVFNGTVELLCLIIFLSVFTEQKSELKCAAEVESRSDGEVLVSTSRFRSPEAAPRSRSMCVSGRAFPF